VIFIYPSPETVPRGQVTPHTPGVWTSRISFFTLKRAGFYVFLVAATFYHFLPLPSYAILIIPLLLLVFKKENKQRRVI